MDILRQSVPHRFVALRSVALFFLLTIMPTWGQGQSSVPRLVRFNGTAKDAQGNPQAGAIGVTFALYQAQRGGTPLWLETQTVQADVQGRYSVYLGGTQPGGLPQELFVSGDARWLGVQVQGQPEQARVLLVSVPYALKASDAETIGGLPPSAFVMAQPVASSAATTAGTAPANSAPQLVQPNLAGSGTVNFVPVWTPDGNTLGNSVLFQSGSGPTVKIGVGTNTPASTLDVKGTGTFRGALSLPATGVATAAAGKPSQPTKMTASAFNSGTSAAVNQNFQWQAEPVNNNTSNPSGSLNLLFSAGAGQPVETGLKLSNTGVLTFADNQTFPGTGTITGVTAGPGLSGGGTNGNITVALTGGCGLGQVLQWNGVTWLCTNVINGVTAGTDLTGGGFAGNLTLSLDTTKVPELNVANNFTANQSVTGNLTATGTVTGGVVNASSVLDLQGVPFATGSPSAGNIFLGFLAGNSTNTGQTNVGTGSYVLSSLTTGSGNVAAGWEALSSDTTGGSNTATGLFSLQLNTTGSSNTASGDVAMQNNTAGSSNTAIGNAALFSNTTGSSNTAVGNAAGPDAAHPSLTNSTAIGANAVVSASNALVLGGTGANAVNVGIGTATPAATLDVRGTGAFTGIVSFAPTQTFPNTVSGVTAGTGLAGGGTSGNVTLSLDTTKVPQLATANTFTGNQTVNANLSATGTVTGSSYQIGSNLFAFGTYANLTAFLGFAGNTSTTGIWNTGSGYQALKSNTSGSYNTADGEGALLSNTTGSSNTANGTSALNGNTLGSYNTADGQNSLFANTTGQANTADGLNSLSSNSTGSNNTGIGQAALPQSSTGNNNTAVGSVALATNTTGSNNTALGFAAGPDSAHTSLVNSTAIGAYAVVSASNALVLGGTGANAVNVGIGTAAPAFTLDVHGTGSFTGLVTFAAGQTFPNTISGVTAGTDLTGGGTGGVPTLSLDTTKVPQLAAANTFTGNQTVNGNLSATGVASASSYQIGSNLFAFGDYANWNAFLGFAGNTTITGRGNTATGFSALGSNTTGSSNTASGLFALANDTTGSQNTASGEAALGANTTGFNNTASGDLALSTNTAGYGNTATGMNALPYNTLGSSNTALGVAAGATKDFSSMTGSNSTFLGANSSLSTGNLNNVTVVGAFAEAGASNALVLGSIAGVNNATADALVGIGIIAPTYKLHVGNFKNSLRVEGPATGGTAGLAASFGGYGDFGIDAPGIVNGRFVVQESGKVGIGTAAPDALLSVNGSADKPGGGSWGTFSDGRLKNLHGDFNAGLAQVLKLKPIRYTYKKENAMGIADTSEHVGFVAQDVQKVIPEAVTQNDKGYLLVNNDPILWTMLNAIKEQQRQIAELRAQLRRREAHQAALEARLAKLEQNQQDGGAVAVVRQPSDLRAPGAR